MIALHIVDRRPFDREFGFERIRLVVSRYYIVIYVLTTVLFGSNNTTYTKYIYIYTHFNRIIKAVLFIGSQIHAATEINESDVRIYDRLTWPNLPQPPHLSKYNPNADKRKQYRSVESYTK